LASEAAAVDGTTEAHGYPHFWFLDDPAPEGSVTNVALQGEAATGLLRWATSADVDDLADGQAARAHLSTPSGEADVTLKREGTGWHLYLPKAQTPLVVTWLRDLSDGFVGVDPGDVWRKPPGPVVVRVEGGAPSAPAAEMQDGRRKPWFIGAPASTADPLPAFTWQEPPDPPLKRTALHSLHRTLGAKMVAFAGWDMPVWYSSVVEEHLATRQAAGLFDVSHMGVYQFEGAQAAAFLDSVATNDVAGLSTGESHYTQLLDASGAVIDDAMIYRVSAERYMMVVNASNDDKDWAWLNAVHQGRVRVDEARPGSLAFGRGCRLRNLRDPREGADQRVDLALQGPLSTEILLALGSDSPTAARLRRLAWAGVMTGTFGGFDLVVSRTGYTGERVAYELFVHPERSPELWQALTKVGAPLGLKPIGLGARDSLRTEAGLPLYGHEMAGELGLGVGHAGFGSYVKTYKPWFIGRTAFLEQEKTRAGEVVRFRFDEKGVRLAHNGDPVVDRRGRVIGVVTSCAVDREGYLLGQAYLEKKSTAEGSAIAVFQSAPKQAGKAPADFRVGDRAVIPTPATVLSRFPR
jgi:glycine hydroxymethyltransferase